MIVDFHGAASANRPLHLMASVYPAHVAQDVRIDFTDCGVCGSGLPAVIDNLTSGG